MTRREELEELGEYIENAAQVLRVDLQVLGAGEEGVESSVRTRHREALWSGVRDRTTPAGGAAAIRACYELDQKRLRNAENGDREATKPTVESAFLCDLRPSS